ncbi:condensation domain-containing protein, partial [Bacillus thuringiensis]
ENSTIKQLSELIQKKDKKHYTVINKAENKKYYKASSAEKRMFALWETDKHSIVYNLPIMIELTEELDICKVEEVLNEIVRRHEALRTSFHVVDGELVQRVHDKWNLEFNYKKLQKKEALLYMKRFIKPFDLTRAPLVRCSLITYEDKNIILLDVHHIVADGVSVGLIRKEFKKLYKGEKLEKPVLQYKDYSEWQTDPLNQETSIKQEQYWLNRLNGELPILNIETDYERPRVKSFEGSRINFTIDKMLTAKLRTIAKETGTTLYMVLLAVYNVMLSKYSNQEDIIVGTAESGRSYADLENTVGMFVNTVALRNFPESYKTFREFLEEVKYNTLKDFDNTDYQFENLTQKLALKRDASRNPLFDVMFTFESMDYGFGGNEEIGELKLLESEINISKFDLTLTAVEVNEHITFNLEYCSKLFKRETAERMGEHYTNLLHNVASKLEVALYRLEMISEKEKYKLLNVFNDSAVEYPKDKTIHQLFEEQVEKTPEHIAVVCDSEKLTYRELNEKSNSLARVL